MSRSSSLDEWSVQFVKIDSSKQLEEEFEFGKKLGEGAFGCVLLARRKADGQEFAVKKMAKHKDVKSTYGKSWENEIRVLRRLQHPHVVQLEAVYESRSSCFLFLELCDVGTLGDELQRRGRFAENDTRWLLKQLGSAIAFLHRCKVVHRDLKLQNCLLRSAASCGGAAPLVVKLTDFGLSIELRGIDHALADNVGTPLFQAPEIVSGSSYSFKCDMWSFGVLFFCLLHGRAPYASRCGSELAHEITGFQLPAVCADCDICAAVSKECREALQQLLLPSPVDRWSAAEFLESAWATETQAESGGNILQLMRSMNKAARQHAADGLGHNVPGHNVPGHKVPDRC